MAKKDKGIKEYGVDLEKQFEEAQRKVKNVTNKILKRAKLLCELSPKTMINQGTNAEYYIKYPDAPDGINKLQVCSLLHIIKTIEKEYIEQTEQLEMFEFEKEESNDFDTDFFEEDDTPKTYHMNFYHFGVQCDDLYQFSRIVKTHNSSEEELDKYINDALFHAYNKWEGVKSMMESEYEITNTAQLEFLVKNAEPFTDEEIDEIKDSEVRMLLQCIKKSKINVNERLPYYELEIWHKKLFGDDN